MTLDKTKKKMYFSNCIKLLPIISLEVPFLYPNFLKNLNFQLSKYFPKKK